LTLPLFLRGDHMKFIKGKPYLTLSALFGGLFIAALLINLFPRYVFQSITTQELEKSPVDSSVVFERQFFSDYYYDLTKVDDEKYLLSTTNKNMYCNHWGEICEFYNEGYPGGSLQLLDSDFSTLWTLGGYGIDNPGIVFNDIEFIPYSADQLTDESVVAIGKSVDTATEIFNITLLFMDSDGNLLSYQHIDLKGMGYVNTGHASFEVLHSENGGFAVQISETREGTVIIRYDSSYTEEWHVTLDDSSLNDTDDFLQSIYCIDGNYYTLNGNTITAIHSDGSLIWSKTYDFEITGFDLTEDEQIAITGNSQIPYNTMISLIDMTSLNSYVLTHEVGVIQLSDGSFIWKSSYQRLRDTSWFYSLARHTVFDASGNAYTLIQVIEHDSFDFMYVLIKHSPSGEYLGQSAFSDSFSGYFERDAFRPQFYKIDVLMEDQQISILMPNFLKVKHIDLTEVEWNSSSPVPYNISIYNAIILTRVWINRLILGLMVAGVIYVIIFLIKKEDKAFNYCDDPEEEHQ
jgi:hypothetical protein